MIGVHLESQDTTKYLWRAQGRWTLAQVLEHTEITSKHSTGFRIEQEKQVSDLALPSPRTPLPTSLWSRVWIQAFTWWWLTEVAQVRLDGSRGKTAQLWQPRAVVLESWWQKALFCSIGQHRPLLEDRLWCFVKVAISDSKDELCYFCGGDLYNNALSFQGLMTLIVCSLSNLITEDSQWLG